MTSIIDIFRRKSAQGGWDEGHCFQHFGHSLCPYANRGQLSTLNDGMISCAMGRGIREISGVNIKFLTVFPLGLSIFLPAFLALCPVIDP